MRLKMRRASSDLFSFIGVFKQEMAAVTLSPRRNAPNQRSCPSQPLVAAGGGILQQRLHVAADL